MIHVGKHSKKCPTLKVHGCPVEEVLSDTYLGDIISSDGNNKLNIESRVAKGLGIVSQVIDILKCVSFGAHYFEIAATLRNSILVSGMLTNCEVWYGLTRNDVTMLEEVDRLLLRQIFNVASTCPIEALYLELGCTPLGLVIKARRVNYLHHLVRIKENEMLSKIFTKQWKSPAKKNEWTEQVKVDLEELGIPGDLNWIKCKSKLTFKNLIKKQIKELAFMKLMLTKERHSKMNNLEYYTLEMQEYLKDKQISTSQAKMLFKFRTRMAYFSDNFKGGYPTKPCPLCGLSDDTQSHSFQCKIINENIKVEGTIKDIFMPTVDKKVAKTIVNIMKLRENYEEN